MGDGTGKVPVGTTGQISEDSERTVLRGGGGSWELPPTESRASECRVPISVPEGTNAWAALPQLDPAVAESPREAAEVVAAPEAKTAIVYTIERAIEEAVVDIAVEADSPPEAPFAADVIRPTSAVLRIALGPAFPGNVHVYDITIDPTDGTFTGVANRASNIRGETISGALSAGNTDIDYTAVYPAPAYEYAWFGTGPLDGFTGGDSMGNVMDALSGTVTYPADDREDTPDVVLAEPEPEPEVVVELEPVVALPDVDEMVDAPPADAPVHAEGCQCLQCRWAAFKPLAVTEGPFAGTAFYFGEPLQASADS